jgi:tRNA (guanine-N7-)-methyltransferase
MENSKNWQPNVAPEKRRIKSFVLRMGRMTAGQQRAMDELWPVYGLASITGTLDFESIFGRSAPVVLEIGIGNGDNLVDMAINAPETNFLGIEVHPPGIGHCLLRIEDSGAENVRLIRDDAVEILATHIADAGLQRVNLFFPDPWHKKRHHKRRIVQRSFIELLAQKLARDGIFHVATDWHDYAEHIAELMAVAPEFAQMGKFPADRHTTRFDSRGARLGHKNWEAAWCKATNYPFD